MTYRFDVVQSARLLSRARCDDVSILHRRHGIFFHTLAKIATSLVNGTASCWHFAHAHATHLFLSPWRTYISSHCVIFVFLLSLFDFRLELSDDLEIASSYHAFLMVLLFLLLLQCLCSILLCRSVHCLQMHCLWAQLAKRYITSESTKCCFEDNWSGTTACCALVPTTFLVSHHYDYCCYHRVKTVLIRFEGTRWDISFLLSNAPSELCHSVIS